MRKEIGSKITLGEYNKLMKNMNVYNKLNQEQKAWLEEFADKYNYELTKVVLQLIDGVLWVVINTRNSVKEFSKE